MMRTIAPTFNMLAMACALCFSCVCGANVMAKDVAGNEGEQSLPAGRVNGMRDVGHPLFCSPHFSPLAINGERVFVANTPADTVDVIDRHSHEIRARINVGIDPVSIAVRPDGKEVWVANHVSDSISVIDSNPDSATFLQVIATIQEFDARTKATRFDEPVGLAFAGNGKAYAALSSTNEIAVIDVSERRVVNRLAIPAQDPRAMVVAGTRLYVAPFESNNKTQLSGGAGDKIDGDLVTFDAWQHSILHNNVLSIGHVVDIVKHPEVPDHDLFVFDTESDELVQTVDSLGTLLYGIAVDSQGQVFVAQTDARNDANGRAGTKKHGLAELHNRAFLNQITKVDFSEESTPTSTRIDLEVLPPQHPAAGEALATPYAIQVTPDDRTLVVTAAGSDKLFTVDARSGQVQGRIAVGAVPRGIALEQGDGGLRAWVYNAVANSVSIVDLDDGANMEIVGFVPLDDPTERQVKLGRTWFNSAHASTSGTYSCASCHPDGHTDQLLWVLKTPVVSGGDQIMPRSTMPVRGLRDTAPFHWDGIPGDPYGGNNSANVWGADDPNSDEDIPESAPRHLIDGGLATTMLAHGSKMINDEGKAGAFSAAQREDMARFLLSVPYPPAQKRAYDNVQTERAKQGFELFHINGHLDEKSKPNVCGDCHRMPYLVSTNTPGTGMDAPTWRGAYDRFLILPQGRLNMVEFGFYRDIAEEGIPERKLWQFSWQGQPRFDPIWEMVLEGSTGYSGAFARQVTLNPSTIDEGGMLDLLAALELSAREGAVVLEAEGVLLNKSEPVPVAFQYLDGVYVTKESAPRTFERQALVDLTRRAEFVGTFTARHGAKSDNTMHPQPALWTDSPLEQQSGHQDFPILYPGDHAMAIRGRHVDSGANVIVDGRRIGGVVVAGDKERLRVVLTELPDPGLHLLQVQNPDGLFSNDFIFNVVATADEAEQLLAKRAREDRDIRDAIAQAIADDNARELTALLDRPQQQGRVNERQPATGVTPLANAALFGRQEIAKLLMDRGAKVDGSNHDGNTPLHIAAFLCRHDLVQWLLERGASKSAKNNRGETPADVVSAPWDSQLAEFYQMVAASSGFELDLDVIQRQRPEIAGLLK